MDSEKINLVIVTSVTYPFHSSIYSPNERLNQLTDLTIKSVYKKIPNPYIVVLEGSRLTKGDITKLKDSKIHNLLYYDISNLHKSIGEATLILNYLNSDYFNQLKNEKNILTISKISGRYFLTENHNFANCPLDKVLIKKKDNNTWSNQGICDTRYYRFPFSYVNQFQKNLSEMLNNKGLYIDLEHSFYKYQIFEFDIIHNIDKINLSGNLAPDGQEVLD